MYYCAGAVILVALAVIAANGVRACNAVEKFKGMAGLGSY